MRKYFFLIAAIVSVLNLSDAHAKVSNSNFRARVRVVKVCTVSATQLNFGTLPGLILGTETTTSTVSVKCSKNTPYTLSLNAGTRMNGVTVTTERVTYAASFAGGTTGNGTGATQTFTINGKLAVQATPRPQDYTATRIVTVTY
jgi:spore coat protein U-like protein